MGSDRGAKNCNHRQGVEQSASNMFRRYRYLRPHPSALSGGWQVASFCDAVIGILQCTQKYRPIAGLPLSAWKSWRNTYKHTDCLLVLQRHGIGDDGFGRLRIARILKSQQLIFISKSQLGPAQKEGIAIFLLACTFSPDRLRLPSTLIVQALHTKPQF